jgi:hypothetical protein
MFGGFFMFGLKSVTSYLSRRKMLFGSSAGALGLLIGTSSPTLAASRPASHWGTFIKNDAFVYCQQFAEDALRSINCTIIDPASSNNHLVIGINRSVFVSVTSIALDSSRTYMIVMAHSDDSAVAEKVRNDVRSYIQRVIRFD